MPSAETLSWWRIIVSVKLRTIWVPGPRLDSLAEGSANRSAQRAFSPGPPRLPVFGKVDLLIRCSSSMVKSFGFDTNQLHFGKLPSCSRLPVPQRFDYGEFFLMGSSSLESADRGLFGRVGGPATHHKCGGFATLMRPSMANTQQGRAHARDVLLCTEDVTTLAEWNQWTIPRRVCR